MAVPGFPVVLSPDAGIPRRRCSQVAQLPCVSTSDARWLFQMPTFRRCCRAECVPDLPIAFTGRIPTFIRLASLTARPAECSPSPDRGRSLLGEAPGQNPGQRLDAVPRVRGFPEEVIHSVPRIPRRSPAPARRPPRSASKKRTRSSRRQWRRNSSTKSRRPRQRHLNGWSFNSSSRWATVAASPTLPNISGFRRWRRRRGHQPRRLGPRSCLHPGQAMEGLRGRRSYLRLCRES